MGTSCTSAEAYRGKCWQYVETVAFTAVGTVGLHLMGGDGLPLYAKAGYVAISFLAGKAAYFAGKEIIDPATLRNKQTFLGRADRVTGVLLGIAASTALGTYYPPMVGWGFREAFTLTAGSYIPAIVLREGILQAWPREARNQIAALRRH